MSFSIITLISGNAYGATIPLISKYLYLGMRVLPPALINGGGFKIAAIARTCYNY